MISKILLCTRPSFINEPAPEHFLCSAIIIFEEQLPINSGYCEFIKEGNNIYIQTENWSITNEILLKRLQMFVRNKKTVIEAGKLPSYEKAKLAKDIFLAEEDRLEAVDYDEAELTAEEIEGMQESILEVDERFLESTVEMNQLNDKINKEWENQRK